MNPFTEPTVARPLAELPVFDRPRDPDAVVARPRAAKIRKPRDKRSASSRPAAPVLARLIPVRGAGQTGGASAGAVLPTIACAGKGARDRPALRLGRLAGSVAVFTALMLPGVVTALDVNLATQEQLQGVRGIGPKTAQIIIDERQRGGRFESFDDLSDRVKGIGPRKAAALQASGLTVDAAGAKVSASPASVGKDPAPRANEPAGPGRTNANGKAAGAGGQKRRPAR